MVFNLFRTVFPGVYVCSKCDAGLFNGKAKYKHDSAWPAFTETVQPDVLRKEVETQPQTSSDKPSLKVRILFLFSYFILALFLEI